MSAGNALPECDKHERGLDAEDRTMPQQAPHAAVKSFVQEQDGHDGRGQGPGQFPSEGKVQGEEGVADAHENPHAEPVDRRPLAGEDIQCDPVRLICR